MTKLVERSQPAELGLGERFSKQLRDEVHRQRGCMQACKVPGPGKGAKLRASSGRGRGYQLTVPRDRQNPIRFRGRIMNPGDGLIVSDNLEVAVHA